MKPVHKQKSKTLTPKEWKKVNSEYSEDILLQIDETKKDLDAWVNVNYRGVIIPMTKFDKEAWDILGRADQRAMAAKVKQKIASGKFEYISYNDILLIKPVKNADNKTV